MRETMQQRLGHHADRYCACVSTDEAKLDDAAHTVPSHGVTLTGQPDHQRRTSPRLSAHPAAWEAFAPLSPLCQGNSCRSTHLRLNARMSVNQGSALSEDP